MSSLKIKKRNTTESQLVEGFLTYICGTVVDSHIVDAVGRVLSPVICGIVEVLMV